MFKILSEHVLTYLGMTAFKKDVLIGLFTIYYAYFLCVIHMTPFHILQYCKEEKLKNIYKI